MGDPFQRTGVRGVLGSVHPEVTRRLRAWSGWPGLEGLLAALPDLQVFLAGGVIRNCLLDPALPVKDFDFFLAGPSLARVPDLLASRGHVARTPFGAPRWHPAGDPEHYADLIPIREFQAGLWECEDIVDVLNQFDFTVSAVAFDLRSGEAFDPQNGVRDIRRRTMRMVRFDFPDEPYRPGAGLTKRGLVWFRTLHYAATLHLAIEPLTLRWLRAERAYERGREEFAAEFFPLHPLLLAPLGP